MGSDYYGDVAGEIADAGDDDWDDEPCNHDCDEDCYDEYDEHDCRHQHCFACGGCGCPGYCDDYQTYNLRPSETGGATCPICNDTGVVQCAEQDGSGVYEQACPDSFHDGKPCPICHGTGAVAGGPGCNCAGGTPESSYMHEPTCGLEPCPRGCPFVPPTALNGG